MWVWGREGVLEGGKVRYGTEKERKKKQWAGVKEGRVKEKNEGRGE